MITLLLLLVACGPEDDTPDLYLPTAEVVTLEAPCDPPGTSALFVAPEGVAIISTEFCTVEHGALVCWTAGYARIGEDVAVSCYSGEDQPVGRLSWVEQGVEPVWLD